MTVEELPAYLREHWPTHPSATARGTLPAAAGATSSRFRRAAAGCASLAFRPCSTGSSSRPSCRCCSRASTRPSRSTATASDRDAARTTRCARRSGTSRSGRRWVVDVDLEKFFDRVNHDVLMGRLAKRIDGQAAAGADPPLPRRRDHGGRGGDGAARGDAARRSALAAAGERAPRRSRQGAGAARTRFRALRRRLQRVRAVEASGRASDGDAAAAVREAPAAHQRGEERGGATVGPQIPRATASG